MSIIVGAGNFGCYTAGHVVNALDESSYLAEQGSWRIKSRSLMPSIASWYTERSRGTFVPNVIYLEHAKGTGSEEPQLASDYQLWRKELSEGGREPHEVPVFALPKEITSVREMLDDQRYVNLPPLRSNRPLAERQELANEAMRRTVEAMDHVHRIMLPMDTCSYSSSAHLDLLAEEQLLPSALEFVRDELSHTPCAVIAGCGLDQESMPTSETHAQRLVLQGALATYLDLHQDFSSRHHTLLIPAYQSPLSAYENIRHPEFDPSLAPSPSARPSIDLNTVYEKAFTASLLVDSLSRVGNWCDLRPTFSPLISAQLKLAPASLTPDVVVSPWSLEVDMTQLHPLANAYATAQTHHFNHVTKRGCSEASELPREEVTAEPLPLSWSSNLRTASKPAVAYECCLSAAYNDAVPRPRGDEHASSSIDLLVDEFLPSILRRSDVVDRIERDHIVELASVLADIRDDCQLHWQRD